MKSNGEKYFKEYLNRFKTVSDQEIIQAFNKEVGGVANKGWGTARASYLGAIHAEFNRRKFDYSAIGDKKSLSLAHKIKLEQGKISVIS